MLHVALPVSYSVYCMYFWCLQYKDYVEMKHVLCGCIFTYRYSVCFSNTQLEFISWKLYIYWVPSWGSLLKELLVIYLKFYERSYLKVAAKIQTLKNKIVYFLKFVYTSSLKCDILLKLLTTLVNNIWFMAKNHHQPRKCGGGGGGT